MIKLRDRREDRQRVATGVYVYTVSRPVSSESLTAATSGSSSESRRVHPHRIDRRAVRSRGLTSHPRMRVLLAVNAPRMAAGIIAPLVSEAEARGVDRAAMLGALGVDEATLGSRDGWVRVDRVFAAWELAMRAIRDDGLPIAVATRSDIEALGVLGYALYTGRDGRSALDALVRYHDLVNDSGTWRLRVVGDQCIVTWDRPGDRLLGMRVANEQVLATFVALSDRITTSRATIHEVTFRHPAPRDVRAHEAHFRGEVRWGAPEDAVAFDAGFLSETPRGFDPVTSAFFEKALAQEKEKAGERITKTSTSPTGGGGKMFLFYLQASPLPPAPLLICWFAGLLA